ncbi:MAG: thioredoxin family protein [Proteobacteria bacterium]|nr:thioredoxin family protein [Pseudomonadota bacterium]
MLEIKVLGPGCSQCDMLDKILIEVLSEMKILADMEHIRDIREIGKYGVMGTPALVINGKVMSVGKVPSKEKLKEWLGEY